MKSQILSIGLVFCLLMQAAAQDPTRGDTEASSDRTIDSWSEVAIDDLHFIRAVLRENHAGPADTLNPWFRDWYERGFREALTLAGKAKGYPGYYFAIQYFMTGFQDGHLGALGEDLLDDSRLQFRWPGFVIGYLSGQFQVIESEERRVPVGSKLIDCDGRSAEELGRAILQTFHGLWSVRGARSAIAPLLFVDEGNPFVELPSASTWDVFGKERKVKLEWRPIHTETLSAKVKNARRQISPPFGVRSFGDGAGYWISLPSFALWSEEVQQGVDKVRNALKKDGDLIRSSDLIVIDVRGNGGGSSSLGDEIVETIWGPAVLEEVRPKGVYVDWRVSEGNNRFLRRVNLARLEGRYGKEAKSVISYRKFVEAMEAAADQGRIFYREEWDNETPDADDVPNAERVRHSVGAQVFFLTDPACFSACLDFADRMRSIPGAMHIGLETQADAVYIDNRSERLPSGLGRIGFSMKVYRSRPRGHNESYIPERVWEGDIADDAALEEWVVKLARDLRR